jgi:hypothetical protein
MPWIGDIAYEVVGRGDGCVIRRHPNGDVDALGVRGRPGFETERAIGGVLYRVQWLPIARPGDARAAGAALFAVPEAVRAAGNCLHLTCAAAGPRARQWWCYRPRELDDGTLSLLHEWRTTAPPAHARRR